MWFVARVLSLTLAFAAPASAGMLNSATWVSGIPILPSLPSVTVPVIGTGVSTASYASVGIFLPAFESITLTTSREVHVFARRTFSGSANITANPSMAGATGAIPGSISLRVGAHTMLSSYVPQTTIVKIPLQIGASGTRTQTFFLLSSTHYVTVDFYAWTVGTRTFTGLTSRGSPLPDAVGMGSFALTADGGGTITLVAPTRIHVLGGSGGRTIAGFDRLTLHFVPEPRALALLAMSVLALSALRRRAA